MVEPFPRAAPRDGCGPAPTGDANLFPWSAALPHGQFTFLKQELGDVDPSTLETCQMVIGMHPDQPTEALVDFALQSGKPFAVVPCCVYPSLFSHRRRQNGEGVKVYSSFIKYLLEKDPRIQEARLPFEGRNRVLYMAEAKEGSRSRDLDFMSEQCQLCSTRIE